MNGTPTGMHGYYHENVALSIPSNCIYTVIKKYLINDQTIAKVV